MRKLKNNAGATLVELLVTIIIGSLVTMAAITVLIFGLQAHKLGTDTTIRLNEVQMGLSAIRELLSENTIVGIGENGEVLIPGGTDQEGNPQNKALLYYDAEAKAVCSGTGAKILEDVAAYAAQWDTEKNPNLVKITVQLGSGKQYTIPVYCRVMELPGEEPADPSTGETTEPTTEATTEPTTAETTEPAASETPPPIIGDPTTETTLPIIGASEEDFPVMESASEYVQKGSVEEELLAEVISDQTLKPGVRQFVSKLASQLGSTGQIRTENGDGAYFSQWYIGSYENNPTWNEYTPWCACYVSWALEACAPYLEGEPPRFANVDTFWVELVTADNWKKNRPETGDLIFFDWVEDGKYDPQHVGVVLTQRDGLIYTIEGNSNGVVAIRQYPADDTGIMGYGILNWKR